MNEDGSRIYVDDLVYHDTDMVYDNMHEAANTRVQLIKRQEGIGHNFKYYRVKQIN
jgi:hypothetical protein